MEVCSVVIHAGAVSLCLGITVPLGFKSKVFAAQVAASSCPMSVATLNGDALCREGEVMKIYIKSLLKN